MLKSVLRDLLAHKARVAMTLVAIVLGVTATVAAWVVSDSVAATLAAKEQRSGVAAEVRSPGNQPALGPQDRDGLARLPGVARADGVIVGRAGLVGPDGKLVKAETVPDHAGTNWVGTGRFDLKDGRAPTRQGEVALNRDVAEKTDFKVGDTVTVMLADGRSDRAVVTGVFTYRNLGPTVDEDTQTPADRVPSVAYDDATAQRLLGGAFHRVELIARPGADQKAIATAARAAVPGNHAVATGRELAEDAEKQVDKEAGDLRLTMLPFAAITLMVGMFVIANTFGMLIKQRTRQYALLRAVGAKRRQVRFSLIVEATVLGLIGGTLGALLGAALGPLVLGVMQTDEDLRYVVSPTAILLGYGVAVLVSVLAAYGSARRAAAVPPVAALRVDGAIPRETKRTRVIAGLGALAIGSAMVLATASPGGSTQARIVGMAGAVLATVGVLLLAPVIAESLLGPFVRLAARRGGAAVRMGVRNAARDPGRTAGTASAITIGLGLVCAFATLSATFAALVGSTTRANTPAGTVVLQSAAGGESVLTQAEMTKVGSLPGVTAVAGSRDMVVKMRFSGKETQRKISAIEPAALHTVLSPKMTKGVPDLTKGAVISRNQADMLGLKLGDQITLLPGAGYSVDTRVVGVYDATELQASLFVDVAALPAPLRAGITTLYAAGPDPGAVRQTIETAYKGRPDVSVTDRDGLAQQGLDEQQIAFTLMYAMFGVAIVVAAFGVVNTLVLSVMERTREIGVVRAVGARRSLVRSTVAVESIVICLFGAVLGVLVGIAMGAVLQHVALGQRLWDITVPVGTIALAIGGLTVIGIVAALWPARRASNTDVLAAIATE
ncbi:putative ABC transport system permease protein [Actinomadura pelletieri DSM 43383]|uniref:Putative ABC transport system permease protein n=1 Tax=Actinomadura pelletieri DSM 43383 TaxID=1120940 RepID=A0A495QMS3_9ACTN|nr:FtsX-like permease family protein [Actinomadura pelletieri]RKS74273.1 putative ABC transport system permease protein [Actinomadura pelletieri DSM 43383]